MTNYALDQLSSSHFAPYCNQIFYLHTDTVDRTLELIEVQELGRPAADHLRQPFSLIFCDPQGGYLQQQTYTLVHSILGALDLFLVPLAMGTNGTHYQAIFS